MRRCSILVAATEFFKPSMANLQPSSEKQVKEKQPVETQPQTSPLLIANSQPQSSASFLPMHSPLGLSIAEPAAQEIGVGV